MATRFDDWEGDFLEHHGIKGQKWGVRRYQNEDGSLTSAGEARYGVGGKGGTARKMTRDFNRLDKSYANVEHRRLLNEKKVRREMAKYNKGSNNAARAQKHKDKALAAAKEASKANAQKKAIESLQWKIIGHASKRGYTINSQAVVRSGERGRTKVAKMLGLGDFSTKVDGQEISIKRHGSGQQRIVNYRAGQSSAMKEEKRLKNMRATAGAYR